MEYKIDIIPQPVNVEVNKGHFDLNKTKAIYYNATPLKDIATYLQETLNLENKISAEVKEGVGGSKSIVLVLDDNLDKEDYYEMDITPNNIVLKAANPRGVFLATQTLKQLIYLNESDGQVFIPSLSIKDKPVWEWRGLMLDAACHFWNTDEVKRFIDLMALYKFNKFHWHLTDDQGWRIEMKKYPLLTQKTAWRTFNNHDRSCMNLAEKQHNTDYNLPENKLRHVNDTIEYGGFYTQEEIKEIVEYARIRGIDIIPEIDMPGHSSAAISCYPELSCFGAAAWGNTFSAPLCPGKDYTLEFSKDIYKELFELFPYEYVHFGADEVEKINWEKCPACQKRIKEKNLKDEKELQSWYVHGMEEFFTQHGKKMIGWDEILEGGIAEGATLMWWRSWVKNAVQKATENGNEVILAPNSHYYFDYQQDDNTLRTLYEFNPVPDGLSQEQVKLIKGVQANTWAEWIPSIQRVDYMTMPRMLALSETAWRENSSKDWGEFHPRLLSHFTILDKKEVNYKPLGMPDIHSINVFVEKTTVTWNYPLAGINIYYTTDGSIPDKNSNLYTNPFEIDESTDITFRLYRPDGTAADIVKTSYLKQEYVKGEEKGEKKPGLKCDWHEAIVRSCKEIETIPVKKEYVVEKIEIPEEIGGKRGIIFSGYIDIKEEDIYTFSLGSDDGSQLYINDNLVVDNDGPHGPVVISGQVALGKGLHPFRLYYFDMNNGGFVELKMKDKKGNEIELTHQNLYY
ncbi:MAG: family 20 glycosylhydrolase [Odoribacter sp.]|nr:family 20 glycosylhydrolase [Odoribacter sp.]